MKRQEIDQLITISREGTYTEYFNPEILENYQPIVDEAYIAIGFFQNVQKLKKNTDGFPFLVFKDAIVDISNEQKKDQEVFKRLLSKSLRRQVTLRYFQAISEISDEHGLNKLSERDKKLLSDYKQLSSSSSNSIKSENTQVH